MYPRLPCEMEAELPVEAPEPVTRFPFLENACGPSSLAFFHPPPQNVDDFGQLNWKLTLWKEPERQRLHRNAHTSWNGMLKTLKHEQEAGRGGILLYPSTQKTEAGRLKA